MDKLDVYEYQLGRLKYTYNRLSKEMNTAAVSQTALNKVKKSLNSTLGQFGLQQPVASGESDFGSVTNGSN